MTRSSSKRKRASDIDHTDRTRPSTLMLNDFVSLPIIISDHDAAADSKRSTSESFANESSRQSSATIPDSGSSIDSKQKWSTGFSDFADDLWSRMTIGMRLKLREACVEVLKRTDEASAEKEFEWRYDDDARFLD